LVDLLRLFLVLFCPHIGTGHTPDPIQVPRESTLLAA
jgi:hypothetical protein